MNEGLGQRNLYLLSIKKENAIRNRSRVQCSLPYVLAFYRWDVCVIDEAMYSLGQQRFNR